MIRSMTGYGRGEAERAGHRFVAELKSVNHRFLNTNLRLPREFTHLESRLVAACSERVERGHLSVTVAVEPVAGEADGRGPRLNRAVLDRYLGMVESLDALPRVDGRVSAEALLGLPGVVEWEPEGSELSDEAFLEGAEAALADGLDDLLASRRMEGEALETDLRRRVAAVEEERLRLLELAPAREERERERLREKVADLLDGRDEGLDDRISQEVVLLADRTDVSEELTRMRAHLDQFEAELARAGESVGRKLTFLLQELNRESNTIGAKASDPEMQKAAIEIKAQIEKMREQAENVE